MVYDKEIEDYCLNNLSYDSNTGELLWSCMGGFNRNVDKSAGTVLGDGYKAISTTYGVLKTHRICWFLYYGEWPNGFIDHIDGNKTNNKITNLRIVTNQQNTFNSKSHSDSLSKYKGVCFDKRYKKWLARICKDGKTKHLGYYTNEIDAAVAYNKAAKEMFGDYGRLNDI